MEVEIQMEPGRREPKVVILAGADTPELREVAERLAGISLGPVPALLGEERRLLPQRDFLRFYTDGKRVSGQTAEGVCTVPLRLYELEEKLDRTRFVRISHSEIVNLDRVTALDLSLAGTIRMTLENGAAVCYVSRRYVKRIKTALGLRKE